MKNSLKGLLFAFFTITSIASYAQVATPTRQIDQTFTIPTPDYKLSPYTGMTRQGWIDATQGTR